MPTPRLHISTLLVPLAVLPALAQTANQPNTFDIFLGPRSIGRATYTLTPAKNGFRLTERYTYRFAGYDTQISEELQLAPDYTYLNGYTTNLSTQLHTSYTPNKTRTDLAINMAQGGGQDTRHLTVKPSFVLLPPYDPGALQIILLQAITHPTPTNQYNVVIPSSSALAPGQGTAGTTGTAHSSNDAYDAVWQRGPEMSGTLNGKPIALHTWVLNGGKASTNIYADASNTLMQADALALHVSYIRTGFTLTPVPPEAPQPPPQPAPKQAPK